MNNKSTQLFYLLWQEVQQSLHNYVIDILKVQIIYGVDVSSSPANRSY